MVLGIATQQRLLAGASATVFLNAAVRADFTNVVHLLGLVYSLSCVYRAYFWVQVPTRAGLPWQSAPLASTGTDRTVATFGECSMAATVAAAMYNHALAQGTATNFLDSPAAATFALLVTAQIWCWIGLLRADSAYHIIEETQWSCAGIMVAAALPPVRYIALAYSAYMVIVDLPMYVDITRAQDPEEVKKVSASPVFDCIKRTDSAEAWEGDVLWRVLYFTVSSFGISALALQQ